MAKTETIILRVDPEVKERIEAAAKARGQSITTFMLTAAEKAARRTPKMEAATITRDEQFRGVPIYFRGGCLEASRGGTSSYKNAAWHLAIHVEGQGPYGIENEDWFQRVDELRNLAAEEDEEGVLLWFDRYYPRCMELVPKRRRGQFAAGVFLAQEEGRI